MAEHGGALRVALRAVVCSGVSRRVPSQPMMAHQDLGAPALPRPANAGLCYAVACASSRRQCKWHPLRSSCMSTVMPRSPPVWWCTKRWRWRRPGAPLLPGRCCWTGWLDWQRGWQTQTRFCGIGGEARRLHRSRWVDAWGGLLLPAFSFQLSFPPTSSCMCPVPQVDASLSTVEALQQLPHVVYALLRGPLLQATPVAPDPTLFRMASSAGAHWHAHPEAAAALQALLQVLPPDEATVAVCPQLSSWASPDEVAVWRHSLSAAALAVEQQPIWCLDTFQHLIVLYSATDFGLVGGPPPPIFPPPAGSLLRRTLAGIRQVRRSTPELLLLRQGIDDISFFNSFLLEDAPSLPPAPAMGPFGGDASTAGPAAATEQRQLHPPSFVSFLESVAVAAQEMLRTGQ